MMKFIQRVLNKIDAIIAVPWQYWLDWKLEKISKDDRFYLKGLRSYYEDYYKNLENPLITVYIPTYNRSKLLMERSLKSAISQTYKNLEILVIGDCCTDDTEKCIGDLNDKRVKFFNLPERPNYPKYKYARWLMIGSYARNVGLLVSKGDWIAYLDDDDIWENDHIEKLYNLTQSKEDVEFVYGGYKRQNQDGTWTIRENPNFISGKKPFGGTFILHSSIMYRSYLSFQLYFTDSYKYGKALDYLFTQRIARSGIKWKFAKGVYAIQPLRPGELTTTYNSIKPFWPRGLDFILLPIIKRFNF